MSAEETVENALAPGHAGAELDEAEQRSLASTDAASRAWLMRLSSVGSEREVAVEELHALLVRAARFTLAKRAALGAHDWYEAVDELALEAADEALVAILDRLEDFRGESRFTTWASKFAFLQASTALRRRSWMGREIPVEDAGWALLSAESTEDQVEGRELFRELKRGVELKLTPHQRVVFVALALNRVPVDVLAERLGTTRGALYKMLHDARRKLRSHLEGY